MSNDGIKYDSTRVLEGIKVVNADITDLEKVKDLVSKGLETIKKAKGYSEIESKLMIKEETLTNMINDCSSEFNSLSNNINSLVNSIEKFDEVGDNNSNKQNLLNNNGKVTQERVKEAIELNLMHNEEISNLFNQDLYIELSKDLENINEGEFTHGVR